MEKSIATNLLTVDIMGNRDKWKKGVALTSNSEMVTTMIILYESIIE
jgi:hypothetical protein